MTPNEFDPHLKDSPASWYFTEHLNEDCVIATINGIHIQIGICDINNKIVFLLKGKLDSDIITPNNRNHRYYLKGVIDQFYKKKMVIEHTKDAKEKIEKAYILVNL